MENDPKYVVTTSRRAGSEVLALARDKAAEWNLPYVDRAGVSLVDAVGDVDAVFIFNSEGMSLSTGESSLRFSLGTAVLRLQSIARGEPETLMRAADLQPGDKVLDATLGLGHDSLVTARAVGPTGSVTGVESSWPLFILFKEGLLHYEAGDESAVVQPIFDDSRRFLASAEESSFDVVILDPMFANPKRSDGNFEVLRKFANPSSLDAEWVQAARRVAKRCVVVKSEREASWFSSEGLERVSSGGRVNWYRTSAGS